MNSLCISYYESIFNLNMSSTPPESPGVVEGFVGLLQRPVCDGGVVSRVYHHRLWLGAIGYRLKGARVLGQEKK